MERKTPTWTFQMTKWLGHDFEDKNLKKEAEHY